MEPYKLPLIAAAASLLLLAYSHKPRFLSKISIALVALTLFFCISYFVIDIFSSGGLNVAALNHLHYALDPSTLLKFWKTASLSMLGIVAIALFAYLTNRFIVGAGIKDASAINNVATIIATALAGLSVFFNPITTDSIKLYEEYQYAERTKLPPDYAEIPQLAPALKATAPENKKNFVLIFAEGYESAYLDESLYPNLTPRLNQLIVDRGVRIRGMRDLVLTNWTHGGMSAVTCGLPMVPEYSDDNPEFLASTELVGETCTGDILTRDGYQLAFFGGSQFGGEDKYRLYKHQGYDTTIIQEELAQIFDESTPTSTWGYYDDEVVAYVGNRFIETVKNNQTESPVGFVILTLDSHQPGLPSPSCASTPYGDGTDEILNGVHCGDRIITDFIEKILADPATADTTILLMSDHLHARPPEKLDAIPRSERDYLLVSFNAHENAEFTEGFSRHASALDMAPTFLAMLGYDVDTFNLGRNLLRPEKTLAEALGRESLYANIAKIRAKLRENWQKETGVSK